MCAPCPLRRQRGKCGMESAQELCLPLSAQGCRPGRGGLVEGLVGADDGEQDRVAHLVRVSGPGQGQGKDQGWGQG